MPELRPSWCTVLVTPLPPLFVELLHGWVGPEDPGVLVGVGADVVGVGPAEPVLMTGSPAW